MNRQQIAQLYDSFAPKQQNMPKEVFIKATLAALNPDRMVAEANAIAQGRIQKAQIDAALRQQ